MSLSKTFRIFAIGGAHVDRRGRMTADFVPGASIPGTMREDVGGGVFNAVRTAVRRGAVATLMSVRGGDGAGLRVAEAIAAEGIRDASAVFLDRATPSYTALLDRHGDVVAALADMELYELAFPRQMRRSKIREELLRADAIFADANLPAAALERLATAAEGMPFFAVAISPAKVVRLARVLPALDCLFMNRREAAALVTDGEATAFEDGAGLAAALSARGLRRGVISDGPRPALFFDGEKRWTLTPPKPRRIADVTGAGDALAGATAAALVAGCDFPQAVREGAAAAMLAVEAQGAAPFLGESEFSAALALVPSAVEMR
ncbi:MAG: carbohydrate kinase family protein [Rhizobiales bacterium]|nr:carbohydrate kinase family protein [Hyphomicrobiales bacterium]